MNKVYNKISVSRKISGSEIGNVLISQPEYYTNVKFMNLNYNSLYFEMISTFPNLRVENQVENGDENVEPTVRIIDERTALDQFVDYRYRDKMLKVLCLYDYKSIVFRRALTSIEKKKGNINRCACFSEGHSLYETQMQHIYHSSKDCRVVSFSGKSPEADSEAYNSRER